jgi:F-type H+-transporting ATPase subunit delta
VANEVRNSGLAERYATALFDLALEANVLDPVAADLASIRRMVSGSRDLSRLVRAPVFSRDEQRRGLQALLHKMDANGLTVRFILLLAAKRRLFALIDIISAFDSLVARRRGEISAQVISARALRDTELEELKRAIKDKLRLEPVIEARIDPSLLGGVIVRVGSRMIDSSLRTKLEGMRAAMRGG